MRISTRLCSVILAGTLACGMGFASLALADSAAPEANPSPLTVAATQAPSFKIFSASGIQVQLPAEALAQGDLYEGDDGVELTFEGDTYGVMASIAPAGMADMADYLTDSIIEEFSADMALDGEPTIREYLVEEALVRDVTIAGDAEGMPATIHIALLFDEDATAIVLSYYQTDDADAAYLVDLISHSLTLGAAAPTAPATGATTEPVPPTTEPDPVPPTTEPGAPAAGEAFQLPGWDVTADTSALRFETVPEDNWDEEIAGKPAIGIPVTLTNTSGETSNPWWDLTVKVFGPSGVAQTTSFDWAFDDSLANLPDMRKNATTTGCIYLADEGDGTYAIEISAYDADYNTVTFEIEFEVAR